MLSERELIALVARGRTGASPRRGDVGIGDDCAVVAFGGEKVLVTTDLMVEGIHFERRYSPPYLLGRKAAAVSLSDIAAMGGIPRALFVSVALPARLEASFGRELADGLDEEAREAGASIMGGDTSASPGPIVIDVIAIGECGRVDRAGVAPGGPVAPVLRSGAKSGDGIYVSGPLGGSAVGLERLRRGERPWSWKLWSRDLVAAGPEADRARLALLAELAHLLPRPRLALGRMLAASRLASAMIDLSDGLATDLHNLCDASGVGARIEEASIPRHPALALAPRRSLRLALSGGEDYELLFTVPRRLEGTLARKLVTRPARMPGHPGSARRRARERSKAPLPEMRHGIVRIGRITPRAKGLVLVDRAGKAKRLPRSGYEHFRPR